MALAYFQLCTKYDDRGEKGSHKYQIKGRTLLPENHAGAQSRQTAVLFLHSHDTLRRNWCLLIHHTNHISKTTITTSVLQDTSFAQVLQLIYRVAMMTNRHRSQSFDAKPPSEGRPGWLKNLLSNKALMGGVGKPTFTKHKDQATTSDPPSISSDELKRTWTDDSCVLYTPCKNNKTLRVSIDDKFKAPVDVITTGPIFSPFPSLASPTFGQHASTATRGDLALEFSAFMEEAAKNTQEKDEQIKRLTREKRELQWGADLLQVEFSAFKKKAAKDLQKKDDRIDTETMNLIEQCLDLVSANESLQEALAAAKKESSSETLAENKSDFFLLLHRKTEEMKEAFMAVKSGLEGTPKTNAISDGASTEATKIPTEIFTDSWVVEFVEGTSKDNEAGMDESAPVEEHELSDVKESEVLSAGATVNEAAEVCGHEETNAYCDDNCLASADTEHMWLKCFFPMFFSSN